MYINKFTKIDSVTLGYNKRNRVITYFNILANKIYRNILRKYIKSNQCICFCIPH